MITRRLARPASAFTASAWTCPACTRASLLSQPPRSRQTQLPQRRSFQSTSRLTHSVPALPYDDTFKLHGIPGLLSPQAFQIAWTNYQALLVSKLNELTAGESYQDDKPKDLAIRFARDPMAAALFNHASMASNNHAFFLTMSPSPMKLDRMPTLHQSLTATFGSIETLRTTMLDTASAMFGPGFVWLVWARNLDPPPGQTGRGAWRILTTYLAGSPYPEAGYRQQGLDTNTTNAEGYQTYQTTTRPLGAFGAHSQSSHERASLPPGGTSVAPVLCVNTWEHVWLRDYGISGKRSFLADWWEAIDWNAVQHIAPTEATRPLQFQRA
ncbi:hypothetical protein BAUCODRAFT_127339 [Baudoinia panamericana UAMH 10762]|uniref:Manganese/iron superoxide dismutase C-terminal domain-containing protein n=1 Tax=Baudoinia panamericana (strain UAMH 10762) TaxID=717646 RepID=M2MXP2_BAUPA|nr:uncharacterized protein BAUCODRAFT_127339 [Baudoinia panamericana UAMH 10762]EMC91439.1 hypothetical protein BAUCODRAFT_127339 [Baudoinia panamericana UAMH 10762]